jgi:hypothetical protein
MMVSRCLCLYIYIYVCVCANESYGHVDEYECVNLRECLYVFMRLYRLIAVVCSFMMLLLLLCYALHCITLL